MFCMFWNKYPLREFLFAIHSKQNRKANSQEPLSFYNILHFWCIHTTSHKTNNKYSKNVSEYKEEMQWRMISRENYS